VPRAPQHTQVQHAPIPGVTSVMVHWWFNGNVDGEMVLNGVVYPRYLVWHPKDHVRQSTLLQGPDKGSATGAFWSIIEFMDAQPSSGGCGLTGSHRNNPPAAAVSDTASLLSTTMLRLSQPSKCRQVATAVGALRLLTTVTRVCCRGDV